jgi:hypothetical protein
VNKRLETAGWGLFLIPLAWFMFIPDTAIVKGIWSIITGLINLGAYPIFKRGSLGISFSVKAVVSN